MFSSMNLSDRLKAAVKEIETHGTALQQRALNAASAASAPGSGAGSGGGSNPTSPTTTTKPTIPTVAVPVPAGNSSPTTVETVVSPSSGASAKSLLSQGSTAAGAAASTATHLAEGALSGLSGLRKSFNFAPRTSQDGHRPSSSSLSTSPSISSGSTVPAPNGPTELKDLPLSPPAAAGPSRGTSPAPRVAPAFKLESDPSTALPTPRTASPAAAGSSHLRGSSISTALLNPHPPPDPSDPSSYPLPLSPPTSALSISASGFLDPLGASPVATPSGTLPPALVLGEPSPLDEKATLGLGIQGADGVDKESVMQNGHLPSGVGLEAIAALADVDSKYNDLLARHSTLLREADSANKILKELTPLEGGIGDAEALEGWVRMMNGKVVITGEELARLQSQIALQDSRMEELRDTHRLEGTSQTDLITKLRGQLSSAETNLASKASELLTMSQLRTDLAKAQTTAKEEEEKRTKAISLLKTVRMKLVKAEKDKEEVEKDRAEERAERSRAGEEVERVKAERESTINALRKGFEREMNAARDRFDKELAARKGAWELEMITTKAAHAKDLTNKNTKISGLEGIVKELSGSKNELFETLQSRQEEVEGAQAEMETLRNRTNELEFQLREATERNAILEESAGSSSAAAAERSRSALGLGVPSPRAHSPGPSRSSSFTNATELQRLLAEAENRSESKLADLRHKIRSLEKERNEAEEEWAVKLQERVHETEKLRRMLAEKEGEYAESIRARETRDAKVAEAEEVRKGYEKEIKALRARLEEAKEDVAVAADGERLAKDELSSLRLQVSNLTLSLEDSKGQYTTLQTKHKTLRDELRKLQSSVQLMEKSRNPGVGYWAQGGPHQASSSSSASASASSGTPVPNGTGTSAAPPETPTRGSTLDSRHSLESVRTVGKEDEEEVNLEYLRNVILQFLEHKEMRPNLVRVLSVILHFTPQELRRLNAKLQS